MIDLGSMSRRACLATIGSLTVAVYATYKLALALIAAHKLNERSAANAAIVERLLARHAKDGGWITDYDKNGKPVGVANVETTSLAILAVESATK